MDEKQSLVIKEMSRAWYRDNRFEYGLLLKEIHSDIEEEEASYIKEWLYIHFRKDLLKNATNGFPEWYKRKIASDDV